MYDRAPRILVATAPTNNTPPKIGPGVYWNDSGEIKIGFAPFLSLSRREPFPAVPDQVAVAPGPGQYSLGGWGHINKIRGGSTLQNKSTRFNSSASVAPGPGTYSHSSAFNKKTNDTDSPLMVTMAIKKPPGRVVYTRQQTAPSIPFPGQSYGYEEDDLGQLVAKDLPEKDTTLGPSYYNVPQDDSITSNKYKGAQFGKLKSQRVQSQFKGKGGPGPADYEPKKSSNVKTAIVQRSSAKLPRYHQILPQSEEKKGVPGPGKYKLPSQFPDSQLSLEAAGVHPPFGCSQQRFTASYPQSPASTKYNNPKTAFDSLKRVSGLTKSPFGQTSARFKTNRNALEIPGPGSYNDDKVTCLAGEALKKATTNGIKQNAFGTTSIRTVPLTKKDEKDMPGPAMYHQEALQQQPLSSNNSKPSDNKGTAVFLSTTQRLYSPPPIVATLPPPGSYEVSDSYSRTQGRQETKRHTFNSAFMSSNSRFAPPRDVQLKEADLLNPGPADYDPEMTTNQSGLLCSKEERFKSSPRTRLGPGSYHFAKSHTDTVLRGTFNATLDNPLSVEEDTAAVTLGEGMESHTATIMIN